MRAAVLSRQGQIQIEERPEPKLTSDQDVVVEIRSVGICGSDVAYFRRGRIGPWVVEGPIILGHEASGVVVDVGHGVDRVAVGDRVAIEPGTPCRTCRWCATGRYHLCPRLEFLATPPFDGALVERIVMSQWCLHPIPDELDFDQAALVEPLSVGLWAMKRASMEPGDRVLITGAGPVGILAGLAAQALGAAEVHIVDPLHSRVQVAEGLGLGSSILPGDASFDVLIECSAHPDALAEGLRALAPGARAALVGVPKTEMAELPLGELVPHEISVNLVHRYAHTWPLGIDMIASGRVRVDGLVTHHFDLGESQAAFEFVETSREDAMKVMIHP